MNGFELLKHLRSLPLPQAQSIPVIAITARGDMDKNDFRQKGFAGMLQKPFNQSDLKSVLKEVLSWHELDTSKKEPSSLPKEENTEETYNFTPLTAFSEDDPEAAQEILRTFVQETRKNLEKIQVALQAEDMDTLCAVAHKMLPTFLMIEARQAIPFLQWLEQQRGTHTYSPEAAQAATRVVEETQKILKCKILKDIERVS